MEDYEIYRENYEYMKCSPLVQSILRENRELKRTIKTLKKMNRIAVKIEPCVPGIVDLTNDNEIEIKTIHLTSEPNIVYDLVECVSDSEDEDGDGNVVSEDDDADASAVSEAEEEADEEEDAEEEDAEEEDAEAEEEEEEEEDADASAVSEADAEEEVEEEEDAEDASAGEDAEEEDAEEEEVEEEADASAVSEAAEEEDASAVSEAEEEVEEEEGVYEVKIKNKTYYVTNETNGTIYAVEADGEVGEEVGKYVDGKAILTVKKTPTKKA